MKEKNVKLTIAVTCVVLLLTVFVFSKYKHSAALEKQRTNPTKKTAEKHQKQTDNQKNNEVEEYTNVSYRINKETTNKQKKPMEDNKEETTNETTKGKPKENNSTKEEKPTTEKPTSKPENNNQQKPTDENTKPDPDKNTDTNQNKAYENAVAAIIKTEQSRLETDYLEAKKAIEEVTNNEQAQQLLDRLNQIELKKDYQQFLKDSKEMYNKATDLLKQYQQLSNTEKKDWISKPDNTNFRKKLYTTKYNNILPTYPNELLWEEHQHKTLRIQAFFDQPQSKNAKVIIYGSSLDYGWLTYYIYQPEENTWYRGPGIHLTNGYKNVTNQLKNDSRWIPII